MAQLRFVTGPVACGKTLELILSAFQLQSTAGKQGVRVMKPLIDTRFAQEIVRSAAGIQIAVTDLVSPIDDLMALDYARVVSIIVDEAQFFTVRQIEQLRRIATERGIDVTCFGLLKDFRCAMFETSKRLLELCDDVRVVKAFCMLCNEHGAGRPRDAAQERGSVPNAATVSMKIQRVDDRIVPVVDGASIQIGGIETFIPVCYSCFDSATGNLCAKNA
ncbi:thymidine kinase [Pancytospora philotis]|nr:thymidine kinase [Pancytospora philotis]